MPYIHSIISLLSLTAAVPTIHAPLEHISLDHTYLPYLTATQITPLQVIQALLPLLRTSPARGKDKGKKSIIVCLPATDARVGLPFASVQAMSAAGTLRGVEVLRREINIASLTEKTDSMRNIKVVVVDIGTFDTGPAVLSEGIYKSMEDWTASEKLVYGPAFVSVMREKPPHTSGVERVKAMFRQGCQYGMPRQPTDLSVLADNLVGVVSGGRYGPSVFGVGLGLGYIRNWIRGQRFSVGAGGKFHFIVTKFCIDFHYYSSLYVQDGIPPSFDRTGWIAQSSSHPHWHPQPPPGSSAFPRTTCGPPATCYPETDPSCSTRSQRSSS